MLICCLHVGMLTSRVVEGEVCNSHILAVPRNDPMIALVSSALRTSHMCSDINPCEWCCKLCMSTCHCLQDTQEAKPQALMQIHHHVRLP